MTSRFKYSLKNSPGTPHSLSLRKGGMGGGGGGGGMGGGGGGMGGYGVCLTSSNHDQCSAFEVSVLYASPCYISPQYIQRL